MLNSIRIISYGFFAIKTFFGIYPGLLFDKEPLLSPNRVVWCFSSMGKLEVRATDLSYSMVSSSGFTKNSRKSKYSAYFQKLINIPSFWVWFLYAVCTTDCSRCSQKMSKFTWTSLYHDNHSWSLILSHKMKTPTNPVNRGSTVPCLNC